MDAAEVTTSPVLIWGAIVVGLLVMIVQAVPKVFGPLGKVVEERQAARRRREREQEDQKDRMIRDLRHRVWRQYRRERRWEAEAQQHREWDREVMEMLTGREPPVQPGPAFMTPDAPEEE